MKSNFHSLLKSLIHFLSFVVKHILRHSAIEKNQDKENNSGDDQHQKGDN